MALSTIGRNQLNTGIDDNSDATAITIDSSERVGVGNASPSVPLDILTSGSGATLKIQGSADNFLQVGTSGVSAYVQGTSSANAARFGALSAHSVQVVSNGAAQLCATFDTSGRVTIPNQPSFQARSNISNLALTGYANTTTHLNAFNVEYFDIGNNYDTSTSTYTAPVAGRYYFYVQLQLNGPTTSNHSWGINLHFQVNGSGNHANGYQSVSNSAGSLFGAYGLAVKENILNLSASDTVRVALSGNTNLNAGTIETATNDGRCRFGGHLLG
tara:strand:+ start:189 stop:1004 length:816 start_codon:yes stop_codon:yes gene_type:complete